MATTTNHATRHQIVNERRLARVELRRLSVVLVGAGVATLLVAAGLSVGRGEGWTRFLFAYLLNFTFVVSLALGGLFFVMLQHLTRAGWSVTLRRLSEAVAATLPYLGILFLPIAVALLLGESGLFRWNDSQLLAGNQLLRAKTPYLNWPFFLLRALVYFAVWGGLATYFHRRSVQQDSGGGTATTFQLQKWSGPGMIAFAITVNFAAFDWLMSLDPFWFSSILGVYFFAGCIVGFLALLIVLASSLHSRGVLHQSITTEHYHDLGKFLFGFLFFWGYIAFSQYLLIWYANISEETGWYAIRQRGGWQWISLLLLFGHLLLPFFGLLSRGVRRNRAVLTGWAVWMLAMHWIDLYWLVMPQFTANSVLLGAEEILCLIGLSSCFLAALAHVAAGRFLIPVQDPRLDESLAFQNG